MSILRSIATRTMRNSVCLHRRAYTTTSTVQDPRVELLEATLPFVKQYGWTMESMMRGARSLGYPSVAHGIFSGGEAGLIDVHLAVQRETFVDMIKEKEEKGELEGLMMNEKIKLLTCMRLELNKPYIRQWPEALAIMAHPAHVPMSLKHLGDIVDDIWYYAGDRSPDFHWYTKRASLAAVYSATDIFMTQDLSPNYIETERFLSRKLDQVDSIESSARQVSHFKNNTIHSFFFS
ncbi:COQ9-domain-containing protein [Gilbertella persicaria]|uniref:COQ9-domain-containing protein n=1 Tax=Gilbertella persicaria TaxID=101096 RepID=UPI00221F3300|nr:COQ9-domain-containing protein [Gilbertella persicaria]KAI8064253.1 COQ9-domain-containing protein [Gilbertella persicaria]